MRYSCGQWLRSHINYAVGLGIPHPSFSLPSTYLTPDSVVSVLEIVSVAAHYVAHFASILFKYLFYRENS